MYIWQLSDADTIKFIDVDSGMITTHPSPSHESHKKCLLMLMTFNFLSLIEEQYHEFVVELITGIPVHDREALMTQLLKMNPYVLNVFVRHLQSIPKKDIVLILSNIINSNKE